MIQGQSLVVFLKHCFSDRRRRKDTKGESTQDKDNGYKDNKERFPLLSRFSKMETDEHCVTELADMQTFSLTYRVTRAHWLSYHRSDVQLLEVLRMGRQG